MNGDLSLVHVLLGFMAPFLGSAAGSAAEHALIVGFIVYQITEREPWGNTIADLGQFAAGYVGGESLAGGRR